MKCIPILILTSFIIGTKGDMLEPYPANKCPSILPFKNNVQTTVLDLDGESNKDFKTCVLTNLHVNQTVLLISGCNTNSTTLLHRRRTTEHPNVIIMTKSISLDILNLPSVKRVIRSHRSTVYIAITNETLLKCKDGELDTNEYSALKTFMNQLWRRYKVMQAAVVFPLSCKEKVAVYSEKINTTKILYDRTIKLIDRANIKELLSTIEQSGKILTQGYPLKANIFFRYPTTINECENLRYYTRINLNLTEGFCGLDALVMYNIVKHFKFKLYFLKSEQCKKYGYATPSNVTGSLGCIVRKELDISFNSRFMTKYSEDNIYYLHYITTDSLCVMLRRADLIPKWYYPISVYENELWALIVALIIVIGILMWAVAIVKSKLFRRNREHLCFYLRDVFTSTMFGFSFIKNRKLYLLRGTCLCSSLMFVAVYQGHINHMFTALLRYETIKYLDDLYRSDKRLFVSRSMKVILRQLENPDNPEQSNFLRQAKLAPDNYTLDFLIKNPNSALLGRKQDAVMEILSEYMDERNSPLINLVDECLYTYYLTYIARAGFPFYEELQRFMQRIGEAGLPIIYYKWTYNMLRVPQSVPKLRSEPRSFEKITLQDQRVAFSILTIGYFLSLIVFIAECVKGRHHSRRGANARNLHKQILTLRRDIS